MRRFMLLLGLLGFAALINPTMRAAAEPYARPYLDTILSPIYEYSVGVRVKDISRRLQEATAQGDDMPSAAEFSNFVVGYYRGVEADVDPWGVRYFLRGNDSRYRVVSAGPDRVPDTGDDIQSPWVTLRP